MHLTWPAGETCSAKDHMRSKYHWRSCLQPGQIHSTIDATTAACTAHASAVAPRHTHAPPPLCCTLRCNTPSPSLPHLQACEQQLPHCGKVLAVCCRGQVLHDAADEREAVAVIGLAGNQLLEHTQAGRKVPCRIAAAAQLRHMSGQKQQTLQLPSWLPSALHAPLPSPIAAAATSSSQNFSHTTP
jgi:hypothetical protein